MTSYKEGILPIVSGTSQTIFSYKRAIVVSVMISSRQSRMEQEYGDNDTKTTLLQPATSNSFPRMKLNLSSAPISQHGELMIRTYN